MTTTAETQRKPEKLAELIGAARVAMLTTAAADGSLRSRPMLAHRAGDGDVLWFFTRAAAAKVEEALEHPRVNVSFADPDEGRYVSLSGSATLVRDRETVRRLWGEGDRAWFPRGPEDPDLALLRVEVGRAEYWDASSSDGEGVEVALRPEG